MGWNQDVFSKTFADLVAEYPDRSRKIFRYKVLNYQLSRLKVLATPFHDLFMHLSSPVEVEAILDNYQDDFISRATGSNQEPGSQKVDLNDSPTYLVQDLAPKDIHSNVYVYSDLNFELNKPIRSDRIFKRKLAATTEPQIQEDIFKDAPARSSGKYVRNVLTLQKWNTFVTAENSSYLIYASDKLKYIKGNKPITVKTDGIIAEFETLEHLNGSKAQTDYVLNTDTNKYLVLQADATKIKPTLTLSTDTFDKTKTLDAIIAQKFITKDDDKGKHTFVSAKKIFGVYENAIVSDTAIKDLWWAFTSVIFNSNQYLSKYAAYKITDETSVNYGHIKFKELQALMFGVGTTDELAETPDQANEAILTAWEQKYAQRINEEPDLNELLKRVRLTLGMLGQYVPSSSAYGNYDKINKLAFNYTFIPQDMTIMPNDDFSMKLVSERYSFDEENKKIKNVKGQFTIGSSNKTFELDEPLTLNQPPEKFIETTKTSRAGSVDTSNPNFLNYMWLLQLPKNTEYDQILGKANPLDQNQIKSKVMSTEYKPSATVLGMTTVGDIKTGDDVDEFINENLESFDRLVKRGSGKITVLAYKSQTQSWQTCTLHSSSGLHTCQKYETNHSTYITSNYLVEWTSELKPQGPTIQKLQLPYNLTLASLQTFKKRYGILTSTFLYEPENIGSNDHAEHKITKLSVKTALDTKTSFILTGVFEEDDPNNANATIEVEKQIEIFLVDNSDQTIIQKGLIF